MGEALAVSCWKEGDLMAAVITETKHVVAMKMASGGRVRVHSVELGRNRNGYSLTDCGFALSNNRGWLWCELRTLNPELVSLCRKCWKE